MSNPNRRLLEILDRLDADEREQVLAFAEFLESRRPRDAAPAEPAPEPRPIPRPEEETVVAAIRRLSETYPMLEKSRVFHETSGLMAAHMLQGRPADEVIDELEVVFHRHYERHRAGEPDDSGPAAGGLPPIPGLNR